MSAEHPIPLTTDPRDALPLRPDSRSSLLAPVALILIVLAVFALGLRGSFVMWDDNEHLSQSARFMPPTLGAIGSYWTRPTFGLYVPLTYTIWTVVGVAVRTASPLADGSWLPAWPFHLLNVCAHAAATWACWKLLRAMRFECAAAWAGAALFALHPVQAEPVAWISGFRDVFGGALALLCLWQLMRSAEPARPVRAVAVRRAAGARYAVATLLLLAALLSKPSAAAVPLVAIVLLRAFAAMHWRSIALRMLPWFAMAAACGMWTKHLQPANPITGDAPITARPLVALDALGFYLAKIVYPWPMSVDYGRTPAWLLADGWKQILWLIPIAMAIGAVFIGRRGRAALIVFAAALIPVLGFVPFQFQAFSTVADRYLYLALFGAAILLALFVSSRAAGAKQISGVIIAVCAAATVVQIRHWRDTESLFTHALAVRPESHLATSSLAALAMENGRPNDALQFAQRSVALDPNFPLARIAEGNALRALRRWPEAERAFRKACDLSPRDAMAYTNLAGVLAERGKRDEALAAARHAVELAPEASDAHANLGMLLAQSGDARAAIAEMRAAIERSPGNLAARMNLAIVFANERDFAASRAELQAILDRQSDFAPAQTMLKQLPPSP